MTQKDWQAAYGAPPEAFNQQYAATLARLHEGGGYKKRMPRTVLIAAAILVLSIGVVSAAGSGHLGGFLNRLMGGTADVSAVRELPFVMEVGDLRFHLMEAVVDGDVLMTVTEVSRADGGQALIYGLDEMGGDPIADLYPYSGLTGSINAYAAAHDLPVYRVHSELYAIDNTPLEAALDQLMEDDCRLYIFEQIAMPDGVHGENLVYLWTVSVTDAEHHRLTDSMEVSIPYTLADRRVISLNTYFTDTPVRVNSMTLMESALGLQYVVDWEIDSEKLADTRLSEWTNCRIIAVDADTGDVLPHGVQMVGSRNGNGSVHPDAVPEHLAISLVSANGRESLGEIIIP